MLRGVMDCFAEEDTELGNSVVCSSDSSHPPTSASTTHFDRLHGSHSSSAATSSLQPYPPPFHMNASAGLCGPVLHGASTYGQLEQIGQGSFGTVVHAAVLAGPGPGDVAIKLLPRGPQVEHFASHVRREILHQSSLQHPCIVSLREVFLTPTHLAIAMEYAPGGDLYKHLAARAPHHSLPEDQARWFFQQLLVGLDYCHRKGVANRDLKLENLLLTYRENWARATLKICDFGYSKHVLNSPAKTCVGTPVYMAPEIILALKNYDAKLSDLWSCGIILYTMVFGRLPFDAGDKQHARKVVAGDYDIPENPGVSAECVILIQQLLEPNPQKRIALQEVMAKPWFQTDLPPGCLTMNEFYCAFSKSLDQFESKVYDIILRASSVDHHKDDYKGMYAIVPQTSCYHL